MSVNNDHKKKLEAVLEDALTYQSVETAFFGMIFHEEEEELNRKDLFVITFKQFYNSLLPDLQNSGTISLFIDYTNTQHTLARISYLYDLLKLLVQNGVLIARNVCEAIIESPHLKFDNGHVWSQSFAFINEFLPQMDYKNVRAVFSGLLNLVKLALPRTVIRSQAPLIDSTKTVINMGLDRNVCLLPSYFVVNEIYKLYPVDNFHLHWALGKEFSDFVNSFKPLAQMVSVTGHFQLFPIIGHSNNSNVWNLDASTLKFPLKGPLPYKSELSEPQKKLLRYVIAQPYSRDVVCSMLGLKKQQKQRCEPLEDLLVELIIDAMEKSEHIKEEDESHQLLWQHLSSQLIFFILFQFASFPHMVLSLHDKLSKSKLNKGRDHLMWVLLQFISGSIQKSALSAFAPVMKLFELLYPETEPIPVPLPITPVSTISFSMACVWVHLSKKAKSDNSRNTIKTPPKPLTKLLEYLYQTLQKKQHDGAGYDIALICNAYSTHLELFNPALQELVSKCYGNGQNTIMLPGPQGVPAAGNIVPLEMKLLDSLSVHAKMSLIHAIVTRILAQAKAQQTHLSLAPGLVETYSRLLVYMEIELLGIKGFIGQVLPTVLKGKSFGILHTLLEMFSYRLHHIQPHYRTSLLSHLHNVATVPFTDKIQLHLCVQNTTLRLIMGFENAGIQMQLSSQRIVSDPKHVLSRECEELNRVLILTIARAMHITGADSLPAAWCEGVLKEVQSLTPLRWSMATLANFPKVIQQFYHQNPYSEELAGKKLMEKIELHIRKIKSLTNEEEIINYCTESEVADYFICILWKMLIDQDRIINVFYQVLMKLRTRALSNYLGVFSDFVIVEFKVAISMYSQNSPNVTKRFQTLNDFIWKYHVIPLDRMILSLVLRPVEDKNSQVCFCVIKYLLLQFHEFKTRVKYFVSESVAQHWKQGNQHDKHIQYHEKFPERFYFEGILSANNMTMPTAEYLPTYFGNVCLRFIPVFDILIHRLLELPNNQGSNILEHLLKELGGLFKFHDRPITYLYNTLHYYAQCMPANLKKKLVSTVLNSQSSNYIEGWSCTKEFLEYLDSSNDYWEVKPSYMINVVGRFVRTILNQLPPPFPSCDWRFNEFTNPGAHALNITCIELMSIPASGDDIGNAVIDVICKSNSKTNPGMTRDVGSWINGVAILLTSLPDPYLQVVNKRVTEVVQNYLSQTFLTPGAILPSFFDFINNHSMNLETYPDYILAIFHATWLHASVGQFIFLAKFLKEQLKPLIMNEAQLLYIFCLFGPFLQRFQQERARSLFEVSAEFYYILEQVCRNTTTLVFVDVITDFLYHIKYMFVGDNLREAVEKTIGNFHEPLQKRLKFMVSPKPKEMVQPQQPSIIEVVNLTNQ